MIEIILAAAPSIVCGVAMAYFNRELKRRDGQAEAHSQARRKESLLSLEMQMATAKMAYAAAMAIKRGTPNGEVEEGVAAYEEARKKYLGFLNEQAADHLSI